MNEPRVAMVLAHPAGHELVVAGLIQRYRPAILFTTRGDADPRFDHECLGRQGLARLGLEKDVTFLALSEVESYRRAFAGDVAYYAAYRDRIVDWLLRVRPDVVFADGFEAYNFHHDLTQALLQGALRLYGTLRPAPAHYECPLHCAMGEPAQMRYQEFASGPFVSFDLTDEEVARKREWAEWVGRTNQYVLEVLPLYRLEREVYRPVPAGRDYAEPPAGLRLYYDELGRELVRRGKHARALLFADHFVPLVRGLGLSPSAARRHAA
jgi:hypothetical protein